MSINMQISCDNVPFFLVPIFLLPKYRGYAGTSFDNAIVCTLVPRMCMQF